MDGSSLNTPVVALGDEHQTAQLVAGQHVQHVQGIRNLLDSCLHGLGISLQSLHHYSEVAALNGTNLSLELAGALLKLGSQFCDAGLQSSLVGSTLGLLISKVSL